MAANRKLTGVLQGRTATKIDWLGAIAAVHFDDGSLMTVETDGHVPDPNAGPTGGASGRSGAPAMTPPAARPLGRVRAVRQQGMLLALDFEDGSALELRTAEATSSVLVRAPDHTLEYAD